MSVFFFLLIPLNSAKKNKIKTARSWAISFGTFALLVELHEQHVPPSVLRMDRYPDLTRYAFGPKVWMFLLCRSCFLFSLFFLLSRRLPHPFSSLQFQYSGGSGSLSRSKSFCLLASRLPTRSRLPSRCRKLWLLSIRRRLGAAQAVRVFIF